MFLTDAMASLTMLLVIACREVEGPPLDDGPPEETYTITGKSFHLRVQSYKAQFRATRHPRNLSVILVL